MSKIGKLMLLLLAAVIVFAVSGCGEGGLKGYSNDWPYPDDVETVYVKMFDTSSFRRGYEYVLTDAICKRIESQTPYKIISDMDQADTVLSGRMSGMSTHVLAGERYSGTPLEREAAVKVTVSWKNLKTGQLLINDESVDAFISYSALLGQDFDYAAKVAVNRAAERVVELMEVTW